MEIGCCFDSAGDPDFDWDGHHSDIDAGKMSLLPLNFDKPHYLFVTAALKRCQFQCCCDRPAEDGCHPIMVYDLQFMVCGL
jgi:hypothetical protein